MAWQSPIALSSGHIGYGEQLQRIYGFDWQAIGAIMLKATTAKARSGNPEQRVFETPYGLINAVGLENPGMQHVIAHKLPALKQLPTNIVANIAGSTLQEYEQVASAFERSDVTAIEVNISCPNVRQGGATFGNDPVMAMEVVSCVRQATTKPLIVKLSPNQAYIEQSAERCIEAGADALSAINTLSGMMIDIEQRKPCLTNGFGGVSGPAILPIALLNVYKVYQVAKQHNIAVIGQGGIHSSTDAIAMFLAGASAISLGTVLARDINSPRTILQGIQQYLRKHNFNNLSELTGKLTIA